MTVTKEQIVRLRALEAVFMPQARRQRVELYRKQTGKEFGDGDLPLRFAHYTSAEAALGIIRSKRLWMRNTTCMTDYREVQHGFDILRDLFADTEKVKRFANVLDASFPDAAMEAFKTFDAWSRPGAANSIQLNTYIASVSQHSAAEDTHGRLSMWRGFAVNSTRVALVFKVPFVSTSPAALGLIFSPIAYLSKEQVHAVFEEVISNIDSNKALLMTFNRQEISNFVFAMLLAGITCLKHEGFGEEQEWRAIHAPKLFPSPLMKSSIRVVGGVPQPIYELPLDRSVSTDLADIDFAHVLDRIIIGPSPYPWVMYQAFVDELQKAAISDAGSKVFTSNIPIRG